MSMRKASSATHDSPQGGDEPFSSTNMNNKTVQKVPRITKHENKNQRTCNVNTSLISHDRAQIKIHQALSLFRSLCRNLKKKSSLSIDEVIRIEASQILKRKNKFVHKEKSFIGQVPGVELRDEFKYWEELNIVGLHRPSISGIAIDHHVTYNGKPFAASVVLYRSYHDDMNDTELIIRTGEGGNVVFNHENFSVDQNLEKEYIAMKNNLHFKEPVRVIIKFHSKIPKISKNSRKVRDRSDINEVYYYYGLFMVKKIWRKVNKLGYKFLLHSESDENPVDWNAFMNRRNIINDISRGVECIPIPVVNNVDDEKVPFFRYIRRMRYPNWINPLKGSYIECKCKGQGECSDTIKCYCVMKNGGKFPYNKNKVIVESKNNTIYECCPGCKCSIHCRNRVSQNGIKFQLEIFKTETKGWGVRSRNTIPAGSFVCEYVGQIIEDEEAVKMIDNFVYLFNISNSLREYNADDYGNYTIDATYYGNVARFINHSCSPNLFVQTVLFDHDDGRIPHIMLFAAEKIPKFKEITFDYNYEIDLVIKNGEVVKKDCLCGASECRGRLY